MDWRDLVYSTYLECENKKIEDVKKELEIRTKFLKEIINRFFPYSKESKILDIGCGYGALIKTAKALGYNNIDGIDISAQQVAMAKKLNIEGVQRADIMEYLKDIPDNSYDVIVSIDLIEHLKKEELLALIPQIHRILMPKGRWIIHTVNGESPFGGRILYGDITHQQAFTCRSLNQVLHKFFTIECYEDMILTVGIKNLFRCILWNFIRILLYLWLIVETGSFGPYILTQNFFVIAKKK